MDISTLINDIVMELHERPVDLLNIGDSGGEYLYLLNARSSYIRTLRDVQAILLKNNTDKKKVRILEIGAYLGVVSVALTRMGCEVTALDIPEFMQNQRLQNLYAQEGVNAVSVNLKDYALPLDDDFFDLVIMCETLEHLNFNPLPVLNEVNRVLKLDGRIYLALPNLSSLPHRVRLLMGRSIHNPIIDFKIQLSREGNMITGLHWREYTRDELVDLVGMTGFGVEQHYFDMPPCVHPLVRPVYWLFPTLRSCQVLIARKVKDDLKDYYFTSATRP